MTDSGDTSPDTGDAAQPDETPSVAFPYVVSRVDASNEPKTDASVFDEPWMNDPASSRPMSGLVPEDQSVWDEAGMSAELAGEIPSDALTWYRWYSKQVGATSGLQTWLTTLGVVLVGGVFAVFGTFATQSVFGGHLIGATVIGPTTEEIMKIALPLWLVEKRPWLYRHHIQILVSTWTSGMAFAAVENLVYLNIYVSNPSAELVIWRWTVCVLLHSGCSVIAGIGLCRIRRQFQRKRQMPALSDGARWILAAIVIHGIYNGIVTLLEVSRLEF